MPKKSTVVTPAIPASKLLPPTTTHRTSGDDLDYDLRNLCAIDPHPWKSPGGGGGDLDAHLLASARDCMQLLANRLFALPTEPCDVGGVLVTLPEKSVHVVPRAKPVPAERKPETRWEKFAREKGIVKRKRGKFVHDDDTDTWKPRYGLGSKKNEEEKLRWAEEVKSNAPWPKEGEAFMAEKEKRKAAIEKQKKHEARNKEMAARAQGAAGFTALTQKGLSKAAPPAVLRSEVKRQAKGALSVAQVSSASLGKFDRRLDGEKAPKVHAKRSRTEMGSSAEQQRNLGVLGKLFSKDELVDNDKAARVHMTTSQNSIAKQRSEGAPGKKAPPKRGGKGKGAHKWTKGGNKRNRS